jgi:hypothetical protein
MSFTHECVMIATTADRAAANGLAVAMGHDDYPGDTFRTDLAAPGAPAATHVGCCSYVSDTFVQMLQGVGTGVLPAAPWAAVGLSEATVLALMGRMVVVMAPIAAPRALWESVLAAQGLLEWRPAPAVTEE